MVKPSLKTALVTGAGKRIGKAIAMDLCANGFAVAIHAHGSMADAEMLADDLRAKGGKAVVVQADLTDLAALSALTSKANQAIGPLGLIVNNASVFRKDSVEQFDEDVWNQHFDLHVRAPSILTRDFCPAIAEPE